MIARRSGTAHSSAEPPPTAHTQLGSCCRVACTTVISTSPVCSGHGLWPRTASRLRKMAPWPVMLMSGVSAGRVVACNQQLRTHRFPAPRRRRYGP